MRRIALLSLLLLLVSTAPTWAVGTQFTGNCTTIGWTPNQESDLAGYKLYDRVAPTDPYTLKLSVNLTVTSVSCAQLGLSAGQHYVSITAYDTSLNESAFSADVPFVIVQDNQITDLRVTVINATDVTLTFTEVHDGADAPANYDVRFATPTISWGTATSVTAGTCAIPLAGTTVGASKSCTVTGLATTTAYQFRLVPFRGTLNAGAVFGPLSNIASATTGGVVAVAGRITMFRDQFTQADGPFTPDWAGGHTNDLQIVSSAARSTVVTTASAEQTLASVTLPNNHHACMTIKTWVADATARYVWLTVRATALPVLTRYRVTLAKNDGAYTTRIVRETNGAETELTSENATAWVATNSVCIHIVGNALSVYRNGSASALISTTDSAITSGGRIGLGMYLSAGTVADLEVDDVLAGAIGTRIERASDTFTRADGSLGPDWVGGHSGDLILVSNAARSAVVSSSSAEQTHAVTLNRNHWIQATVKTLDATGGEARYLWLTVRSALLPEQTRYRATLAKGDGSVRTKIERDDMVAPMFLILENVTTWAATDVMRFDVIENTLLVYRNGTLLLTWVDGWLTAAGRVGMGMYLNFGSAANAEWDTVSIGEFDIGISAETCGCENH